MRTRDISYDRTYPTYDRMGFKLPFSIKYVIFANYYFTINGWSVFYFMMIYLNWFRLNINNIYIIVMLVPAFILSALSTIISKKLLQRTNILLSSFQVIMAIIFIDMINSGPISSGINAGLVVNRLYWFLMILLIISLLLSGGSLFILVFDKSLKQYYQVKDSYIKPWFIQNFGVTSIIASVPLVFVYIIFF